MALAERLGIKSWEEELGRLIDLVRANAIEPARLPAMAQQNADGLIDALPKAAEEDLDAALIAAIDAVEPPSRRQWTRSVGRTPTST
jgi:hypothetical protein